MHEKCPKNDTSKAYNFREKCEETDYESISVGPEIEFIEHRKILN